MRRWMPHLVPVFLGIAVFLPGLEWGLPSAGRAERVLPAAERTPELLEKMARARQAIYDRSGGNPNVELGRKLSKGEPLYEPEFRVSEDRLLLAYSSFLIRSMDPDEQRSLAALAQMKPRRLEFNPHYFVYGGLYLYPLGGWLGAAHVLGLARLVPDVAFYYREPGRMGRVYLAGRLFTAVFALAALVLLAAIVRRLFGPEQALFAAAFAALTPAMIAQAHLMKPHVPGTFFALLCLHFCFLVVEQGPKASALVYAAVGAAGGAAMSNNPVFASFCGLALLLAHFSAAGRRPEGYGRLLMDRRFWLALVCFGGVYLATNPYALLAFAEYRAEITGYQLHEHAARFDLRNIASFLRWPLLAGLGGVLALAGALALPVALARGTRHDRFLAALLLVSGTYLAFQLGEKAVIPEVIRYFLPGLVTLAILIARLPYLLLPERLARGAALALALAALVPAVRTLGAFVAASQGQPGFAAGDWIEKNLADGSRIGIFQSTPHVYEEPPFRFGRYRLYSLGPLMRDPGFRISEPLPETVVWGANHSTLPKGDDRPYRDFLESQGYALEAEFHGPSEKDLLTTAGMPFYVYRLKR